MAVSKITSTLAGQILHSTVRNQASINSAKMIAPIVVNSITRRLSTLKLTNNIALITGDKRSVKVVDLKLTEPQHKPLVVILSWLMAKPKHIHKFANYYIDKGFDVLNINTSPWQLLWPVKGSQIIAGNLVKFLEVNECYQNILIHGFSVGGYQWGETLVKIEQNQEQYKNVINRIVGHIWDSCSDYTEIAVGVPLAMFPDNLIVQKAIKSYMDFHLKIFHKTATQHYIKSSELFHSGLIKSPSLFLLSKTDPVGPVSGNLRVKESLERAGIKVYWKCWDDSPHVGHYYLHTEEYIEQLDNFLKEIRIPTTVSQ